jgi:beta-phosphoglucomutase-like phosphatase (HAD superfamily)
MEYMLQAVIFDMDGVLIDSEPLWQEAEIRVFSQVGIPLTAADVRRTMGLRVDAVVAYWFSRHPWLDPPQKTVEDAIVETVIALVKAVGTACDGVDELITLFKQRTIPLAIASSSPCKLIEAVLDKLSLRQHIPIIHSAEMEVRGKPHPAVYLTTAKKLGICPEHCLVFEDSPNGVLAAKAATMRCVAVPNAAVQDDPIFAIADLTIPSLKDFRWGHVDPIFR